MKFRDLHRLTLFLALGGLWFITACNDTPARHKLLTVFFDGVPPLNTGTNSGPAKVSITTTTNQAVVTAPPQTNAPPENAYTVHEPFQQRQCDQCHVPSAGMALKLEPPQLCWSCHKDFTAGQKDVHFPVDSGDCLSCHDAHQSENKNLLLKDGNALCLSCHDDPLANFKFKHEAVELGDCLDCHDAHASNIKGLLKKSVKETCEDCHADLDKKKDVHQPVDDGDCLDCHDPHASNNKNLVKKTTPDLCWDCHDNFLEKAKFQHDVVEDCDSCHDPHSTTENFLLLKNQVQLCEDCHDEKDLKTDKGHAGFEGKNCTDCHDPHVGDNQNLLKPSAIPK